MKTKGFSILFLFRPLISLVLYPMSLFFRFAVFFKNWAYNNKILKINKLPYPVISVGNVSVGGSGKTPVVMLLLKNLPNENLTVLSRGYGSEVAKNKDYPQIVKNGDNPKRFGDEPSMMAQKFPRQTIVLDSDRFRGAHWLMQKDEDFTEIFILDDAFQHRKLHRDIDIVILDVNQCIQKPGLLPYGRFREPIKNLKRSDIIILSKWQNLEQTQVEKVENNLKSLNLLQPIFYLENQIGLIKNINEKNIAFDQKEKILLFSAIGSPDSFLQDLTRTYPKIEVIEYKKYPDHYDYTENDIRTLQNIATEKGLKLICTEKDFVKIKKFKEIDDIYVAMQDSLLPDDFYKFICNKLNIGNISHDKVLD